MASTVKLSKNPLLIATALSSYRKKGVVFQGIGASSASPFTGIGKIVGTVSEKALPSNHPLSRRVVLLLEPSQQPVMETTSNSVTGYYEFKNLSLARTFTVIAFDHTGTYRAVIADKLTPQH